MALWHRHGWVAYMAVFIGVLGHSSAEFFAVLSDINGPELSVWRFVLGGSGLAIVALAFSDSRDFLTPIRTHGKLVIPISLLGISGGYLFFHWSLDFASVPQVATIVTAAPMFVGIINFLVNDLIYQTKSNIRQLRPRHIDDVRAAKTLASFSEETKEAHRELKLFLGKYLYRHKNVVEMAEKSKSIVRQLFNIFFDNPVLLPKKFLNTAETCQMRGISDYIAGMTDRYAIQEHNRLCSPMQSQKSK